METILKLGDLERWVRNLGLESTVERKFSKVKLADGTLKEKTGKREYIEALQRFFLSQKYPDGVPRHVELALRTYPQMAARQNQVKPEHLEEILESPDWVCEEKIQGFRTRLVYVRGEGAFWYSRYLADSNMLPKIVSLPEPQILSPDLVSFVLDTEVMADDSESLIRALRDQNIVLDNEQEATTFVLQNYNPQDIVPGISFTAHVFDIPEVNGNFVTDRVFEYRKYLLSLLLPWVQGVPGFQVRELPFSLCPSKVEKLEYFQKVIDRGGEGMILKDKQSEYETDARPCTWLKFKREKDETPIPEGVEAPSNASLDIGSLLSSFST